MKFELNSANSALIKEHFAKIVDSSNKMLGYPVSRDFDYSELNEIMRYPLNNVGDPRMESTSVLSTKKEENEVIDFFANLFRAPQNNYWGYVTNGGTEGNLYGLYLARELYPNAMVYHSEATHYSVQKNLHLLKMDKIVIRSQPSGEMNYEDLEEILSQHRHRPAIVFANIGTTMTEAKDNVATIKSVVKKMAIRQYYIHSDAALAGVYTALLEPHHPFDFVDGADSIAISGHKFIGAPIPCGLVIVKKNYKDRIGQMVPYIGSLDTTITGSRNGHTPWFLWYAIKKWGIEGFRYRAQESLDLAAYTEKKLQEIGWHAWRNPNAITVVLKKPHEDLIAKWQLASEEDIAHIICMPGVKREQIDAFLADMKMYHKHELSAQLSAISQ